MARRPGQHAATLRDVARESGVSIATVSYSLNGGGTISHELREHVRHVADRVGYQPNRAAQAIRTGRSHTLGLVVPDLRNPFFPELAQAVEQAARAAGYVVMLVDTQGETAAEADGIAKLRAQNADGIIWCRTASPGVSSEMTGNLPTVVVGPVEPGADSVTTDDRDGGRQIAGHLIAAGHRTIGLLSGTGIKPAHNERRAGFLDALGDEAKLVWDLATPYSVELSPDARVAVAQGSVSAIVCGNDLIAIAVLRTLREVGVEVPAAVSVVGFDDIPWSQIVTPQLTTVRQPVAEMGAEAVALLLSRLDKPDQPVRRRTLPVSLIERESSGPLG